MSILLVIVWLPAVFAGAWLGGNLGAALAFRMNYGSWNPWPVEKQPQAPADICQLKREAKQRGEHIVP